MNEELQKKYMEIQILGQQAEQLQHQLQAVEQQLSELTKLDEGLEEIKDSKGKKIIMPFGAGIYLEANLGDTKDVLMNVGADTIVKKGREEAKAIVSKQRKELERLFNESEANFNTLHERMAELQHDLSEVK